jgi:hypothetical protein
MTTPVTLLEEVAQWLDQLGLGDYLPNTVGGSIFLLQAPQTPDVCIAVAPYTSVEDDQGLPYDKLRFQFRIRGQKGDKTSGYRLAKQVFDAVKGHGSTYLPAGTWMLQCLALSGPALMGFDESGRDEYTVNVEIEVATRAPRARAI